MKKSIIFSLLISSMFSLNSFACSCADWEGASTMLAESDMVALVVPTEESKVYQNSAIGEAQKTGMKIVKRFKGKYKSFMYLLSEKNTGTNCGVNFNSYDGLWLVMGYKVAGEKYYVTGGCSVGFVTPEDTELTKLIKELGKL